MLDWLDRIPNLGVPGVPGVQPQKSATFRGTPADRAGVLGVPEHLRGTPGTPTGTPPVSAKSLNIKGEHTEHREHRKNGEQTLALIAISHEGLRSLDPRQPLHGLTEGRWAALVDDADWLFEQFADAAAVDGWSAADLFGVLPGHDGWGGIADRMRGSRSLVMTADMARWRRCFTGTPDIFVRGASEMPSLALLWDQITGTKGGIEHA